MISDSFDNSWFHWLEAGCTIGATDLEIKLMKNITHCSFQLKLRSQQNIITAMLGR